MHSANPAMYSSGTCVAVNHFFTKVSCTDCIVKRRHSTADPRLGMFCCNKLQCANVIIHSAPRNVLITSTRVTVNCLPLAVP